MAKIFLLTGLSGAGKTTLASGLQARLANEEPFILLDGDAMRKGVCSDLGFSAQDRAENIRRCGEMAKLLASQGVNVLLAVIAPYEELRRNLARIIRSGQADTDALRIIHVACPLEVCIARDPKKNYQKALAGAMSNYTGIADIYEPPQKPDFVIETSRQTVAQSLDRLEEYVRSCLKTASKKAFHFSNKEESP